MEHVSVEQKEEKWDFVEGSVGDGDEKRKIMIQKGQRDLQREKGNGERKSQLSLENQLWINTGEFVISNVQEASPDSLFKGM